MSRHYYNLLKYKREKYAIIGRPANGWTQEIAHLRAWSYSVQNYSWAQDAWITAVVTWMGEQNQGRVPQTYQAAVRPQ